MSEKKKSSSKGIVSTGLEIGKELLGNTDLQRIILGTYSDGTPRSNKDAIDGEIYSPKQKGKAIKRNKKRNKKNKRNKFKL